jgi:hypothetical protein
MLTLTSTLLTAFGNGTIDTAARKMMLGCVGFSVFSVVVIMAISIISGGTKKLKQLKEEVQNGK